MTAATMTVNPPLPYTKKAIIDHLRHQATNGPAYVQLGATKTLARFIGLYEDAKHAAKHAVSDAGSALSQKARDLYAKADAIRKGEYIPTKEELGEYAITIDDDDEEEDNRDEDEPP